MVFLDSQNYQAYGWKAGSQANINRNFSYKGYTFPGGVAVGTEKWFTAALDIIVPKIIGGIHPGGYAIAGTWGYQDRANVNNPSRPSFHAGGLALDINAPWNPNGASWQNGKPWGIPSTVAAPIRAIGGIAGGEFRDPMHVECHLTPAEARAFGVGQKPPQKPPAKPAAPGIATDYPLPAGYYFGPLSGPNESISGMARNGSDAKYRPAIKRIQKVAAVPQDGMYGPNTIAAVKRWQAAHKLAADGLTGPRTWRAMGL
jgi:peptidoglycan hydrolase-like protein with peptidoglycan-binding domain